MHLPDTSTGALDLSPRRDYNKGWHLGLRGLCTHRLYPVSTGPPTRCASLETSHRKTHWTCPVQTLGQHRMDLVPTFLLSGGTMLVPCHHVFYTPPSNGLEDSSILKMHLHLCVSKREPRPIQVLDLLNQD